MKKSIFCLLLTMIAGCSNANKIAQTSLDRAVEYNADVRMAFFTKAWILNRALIKESREKFIAQLSNKILQSSEEGKINTQVATEALETLSQEVGNDEAVASENFAYLVYLLVVGERSEKYIDNVDFYLESKKPIWKKLFSNARNTIKEGIDEVEKWKPLVKQLQSVLHKE